MKSWNNLSILIIYSIVPTQIFEKLWIFNLNASIINFPIFDYISDNTSDHCIFWGLLLNLDRVICYLDMLNSLSQICLRLQFVIRVKHSILLVVTIS